MDTTKTTRDGDLATSVLKRRGLMAAAWAAVLGLVLKRTEQPVQAALNFQFQDVNTTTAVQNLAGGPTAIRATAQYASTVATFTGMAGSGLARAGTAGGYGNVFLIPTDVCGVIGYNFTATTGSGVIGIDYYSAKAGVHGLSGGTGDGGAVGVLGESGSGVGVRGQINATSDQNAIAVYGLNNSTFAGPGPGAGGFGVYGLSARGHGLVGATAAAGGAAVVGATNGVVGAFAGAFYGPVIVGGDFTIFGAKSAAVPHPDGSRRLVYCMESPDSWFEDFGTGALDCGGAAVSIDPDFAAIVDLSDYHVFLTSYDIDVPLYVMKKTTRGFRVEADATAAAAKGKSASALTGSFSWRVVAKRKDIAAKRLAPVTMPPQPELPDFPETTSAG